MKLLGLIIVVPLVAMAAIPILMGAVIFAPVVLVLVLLCAWSEGLIGNRRS